jgi:ribonuclease D
VDVIDGRRDNPVRVPPAQLRRRLSNGIAPADKQRAPDESEMDGNAWALFTALKEWRDRKAEAQQVPHYAILHDSTLRAISVSRPLTDDSLLALPGIGPRKLEQHGAAIFGMVRRGRAALAEDGVPAPVPAHLAAHPADGSAPPRTFHEERVAEARRDHPRAFERWTSEEDARLQALFAAGSSVEDVSRELQRQPGAIRIRGEKLGALAPGLRAAPGEAAARP